jgi:membrane associated rhomboid family serine protease
MDGASSYSVAFPRPGRALKFVLVVILALGIFNAFLATWIPGGARVFALMVCDVDKVMHAQVWRLLSSGLLTDPTRYSHLIFTLLGLYFLAPDLERRWGEWRFLRFLGLAVAVGNLLSMGVGAIMPAGAQERFHQGTMFGATAAIAAIAVAWARTNADLQVRLFFLIPVRGRYLLWVTLLFCVLDLIYPTALPEGVIAPFGGVVVGLLFGGTPSLARTLWLRARLALLQRRSSRMRVEDVLAPQAPRRHRPGSPPLRVVQGGLDDVLKSRKPPKDKRYLN